MPYLLKSPDEWFRETQRDLYFFSFKNDIDDDVEFEDPLSRKLNEKALREWFAQHLPDVPLSFMGSSEDSGIICGGPIYLQADFTPENLAIFCSELEDETGASLDPRWQCKQWQYGTWLANLQYFPILNKPQKQQITRALWWLVSDELLLIGENINSALPSTYNSWFLLCRNRPELKKLDPTTIPNGIAIDEKEKSKWFIILNHYGYNENWDADEFKNNHLAIKRIRESMHIPESAKLTIMTSEL